jgi:large subunit ribosomal protein L7/L12
MSATYAAEVVEIGDQISALSPSKAGDLLAYLKETYNIEPAFGPPQLEKQPEKQPEKPQEQTEWSVILTGYDTNNKVGLVKTYRELSGKGLKESMDAIVATATTPLIIKDGISKTEAEKLKATLEAASGKVEIK